MWRSTSPWACPLHMVPKKDSSWQPCGDFRQLNLVTEPDRYPLPNMLDFADRLSGCTVFSKIDLRKGYWQVPVHSDDISKTAVIMPFGLYEFLRMAFSLRNAGASFQWMMDRVIRGLTFVYCYLDDLRVASRSPEEHVQHLRILFQRLQEFGLVINLEKCSFHVSEIEFLGHHMSWCTSSQLKCGGSAEVSGAGYCQGHASVPWHGQLLQTLCSEGCLHVTSPAYVEDCRPTQHCPGHSR